LPASPFRRAVPTTPADRTGASVDLLPHPYCLPRSRRVGIRNCTFEACSGFIRIRPIGSLDRPRRPLSRGFDPPGHPGRPLVSYQINRQLSGWNLPPLVTRAVWAHVESRTGAVAWAMRRRSVSRPRSSNRTCGFPASGFPTGFIPRHTAGRHMHPAQLKHAELAEHRFGAEAAGAARGHRVAPNRLRREIQLPLEGPDQFGCLQAHRQSPSPHRR